MTASLTYDHPERGVETVALDGYHTQPNGVLVATAADGYRIVLPPGEWVVTDGG